MRKITLLLITLTLLFVGVGGAYAGKTYASCSVATGCTWNSETNTMSFTAVNGWQILLTGLPSGDITEYTKFHATLSSMSDNIENIRFCIKEKDENPIYVDLVQGENNINLQALAAANPTVDFTKIKDITLWSPSSAASGKTVDGEHPASVKITDVYLQKPTDVVIGSFANEITSLAGITDGTKFVIANADASKAMYFVTNSVDSKNNTVNNVPNDGYYYYKVTKIDGLDTDGDGNAEDDNYTVQIVNESGTLFPNPWWTGGSYLNYSKYGHTFAATAASGVNQNYGWDFAYGGIWKISHEESGFVFQCAGKETEENPYVYLKIDGTQAVGSGKVYLKLYKSISFDVNSDVDVTADENVNITVGGETRNYQLYVPEQVQENCPLVISLHGANGHSTDYSPFRTGVADTEGCIVAYPQGKETSFPIGFGGTTTGWTASGDNNFDVKFLKAVIEDVASKYQIDRKRIYCCGFSNGGMMTYALSNTCSDVFAAFASISGFPLNEFHLRHTGSRPVPFMHIHGKADNFVLYEKMPTIVDEMVARLGANPVPTTTTSDGYTKNVYQAADGSFPYVYYEIDGMGHVDYTDKTEDGNSAQTMWNFFEQYTLESQCDETLKWAPRIEEEGYTPAEHGWTVNSGTTLLSFGGDQYTTDNKNVYRSLQFSNGQYKLNFKSAGDAGKTIGVKIEKLTSPNTVVLNETVNVGADAELPFEVTDGWGEYKLTITRPSADDAITITEMTIMKTGEYVPGQVKTPIKLTGATGNPTIVPIAPSTLENLYAAMFTPTEDYSRMFRYENMDVKDYDKIVIKFKSAVSGDWRINMPDGSFPSIAVGSTELEIDLSKYATYGDFTIFNWGSERTPISISEAYFVRTYELVSTTDWTSIDTYNMWHGTVPEGGTLEKSATDGALKIVNPSALDGNWKYQYFVADGIPTVADEDYIVSITLKSTVTGNVTCVFGDWGDDNMNKEFTIEQGNEWVTKDIKFTLFPFTKTSTHVLLQSGNLAGTILIKKVEVFRVPEKNPIEKPERTATDAKTDVFAGFKTIDGDATWDSETRFFTKKCGWQWDGDGIDLSQYRYLIITAGRNANTSGTSGLAWNYGLVSIKDKNNIIVSGDDYGASYMNMWFSEWNNHNCLKIDLEKLRKDKFFDIYHIKELTILGDQGFILGNAYASNQVPENNKNWGGEDNGDFKIENLPADKFGTICLPYQAAVAGAYVYEITGKTNNSITLSQRYDLLEAGKPYIFKSNASLKEATTGNADTKNVYFYKATAGTVEDAAENNGLIGTFTQINAPMDSYVLSKNKLYKVNSNVAVKANKAYIDMSKIENVPSAARSINLVFNETTGIKTVIDPEFIGDGEFYNLQGQRISAPTKGLYIVNGKKVIMK